LYLASGRYQRTITICNELLHDDPDNRCLYALRGYAHLFEKDNARQAIADFSEVLKRDSGNATIYVARAKAFELTKEYDRTIADCNEAIRIDPRSKEAYATRGECYEWKKVTGKAIADYTAALRIDPEFAWARGKRANTYLLRGEGARALADLDELLRLLPENREVQYGVCSVYLFIFRDYDRAIAKASELIRSDPREARWYWLRCMTYLAKGEYIPSCCDAVRAVILNPRTIKFRVGRHSWAVSFLPPSTTDFHTPFDNDDEERIESCTKRLQGDPKNPAAHYERACAYISKHDLKRAAADLDEIIRLDPSDAEAYRMRGSLHVHIRAYSDALDDYAKAMQLDPGNADCYTGRACAYTAMGKYEEAIQDCAKGIRLDPCLALTYAVRGSVYERSKEYDRAIADYSEAIRLSPADPKLYQSRANVRCCLWDCAGVISDYKQAVKLDPSNAHARAVLAGYLCYCPDASLRDGKEARRLATAACEATAWRDLECLVNLALACAECGDFDAALKWETEAGKLVPDTLKQYHQERLELYRAHKPYHELRDHEKAPDRACEVSGIMRGTRREEYEIKSSRFAIPIGINGVRREDIEKIRLFVSEDEGKTWKPEKDYKPGDERALFTAPHDGRYWFAAQIVLKNGDSIPAKLEGPALKVYVNSEGNTSNTQKPCEESEGDVEQLRKKVEHLEKKIKELQSDRKPK
jgi:tetratricopeptide (TPR) repeat protein